MARVEPFLALALVACGQPAPPRPAPAAPIASAPVPVVGAGAPIVDAEVPSTHLGCGDNLWVVGRAWNEQRTSSTTSVGEGGYMGDTWEGARKITHTVEKKILAMDGDAITKMRVRFHFDRDPDGPTRLEGKAFLVTARAGSEEVDVVAEGDSQDDREAVETNHSDIAELVPEMTEPRWRGDARVVGDRLLRYLGWSKTAPTAQPPQPPTGKVVVTPGPVPKGALFADARAFTFKGSAVDESAGLGHFSDTSIRVSGQLLIRPDGTLVALEITNRAVITEGTMFGCGPGGKEGCPAHRSAIRTANESFHVLCGT